MIFKQFFNSVTGQELETNKQSNLISAQNDEKPKISRSREIEVDIKKHLASETGKDRILAVFNRDKSDIISPQFRFACQTAINTGNHIVSM